MALFAQMPEVLHSIPVIAVAPTEPMLALHNQKIMNAMNGSGMVLLTAAAAVVQALPDVLGAPVVQGTPVKETPGALRIAKIGAGKGKKRKEDAKAVVQKNPAIFKKRATRSTSKSDPRIRRVINAQTKGRKLWKV